MKKKATEHTERISEESLLRVFKREKRPLSAEDLRRIVNIQRADKRLVKRLLNDLARKGQLVRIRDNRFGIPDEMNLETGTLWCTRSGNGFLIPDKEGHKDIFVPARYIKNAMHGDKVVVRVEHTGRQSKEGRVIKVAERRSRHVIGFLKPHNDLLYLVPEDERLSNHFLVARRNKDVALRDGDLVAARITRFPEEGGDPECTILKIFKGLTDVKSISQFITYKHNLPHRFRKQTDAEAKATTTAVVSKDRLDLRGTRHVTIDGEFAKDFDDAVFIEKTRDRFTLYVSIADASHYVRPGSAMDHDAYERATSVYFPGSVIPMLPKELSNGICSLNPDEERLTMTARLEYSSAGRLLNTSFHESVIRSAKRLTYKRVEDALVSRDNGARAELESVLPELEIMGELAALLGQRGKKGEPSTLTCRNRKCSSTWRGASRTSSGQSGSSRRASLRSS